MKFPVRGCLFGASLFILANVCAGETVHAKPVHHRAHKPVQAHAQSQSQSQVKAAAPAGPAPSMALSPIAKPYTYQSPFEKEYGKHLEKTTGATPGNPDDADAAHEGATNGPRTASGQVDSEGVPNQALHPQSPPLVTVGDWDLSADAHLPLARTHDTGAAISAKRGF
jgi:hypothetical protein